MKIRVLLLTAALALMTGCLSAEDEFEADQPPVPTNEDGMPLFTDLYIEYPAPGFKWAAGEGFSLHLSVRDAQHGQLALIQGDFDRAPASLAKLNVKSTRESMARVYASVEKSRGIAALRGCANPLRVRFVRADGILLEKQDCRGGAEWTRTASEVVAEFRARYKK